MNYSIYSFLLFIFLKQFYIFSSGSIQPADLFLVLSFIFLLINSLKVKRNLILRIDYPFFVFILFVLIINTIYLFIYLDKSFLLSSIYYIYILLVVVVFRILCNQKLFLNKLMCILRINIILQLCIYILNLGKFMGGTRYMGTFNDPNQFSFFIFSHILILFLLQKVLHYKFDFIMYFIVLFMIFQSQSTGMLMGIIIFSSVIIISKFKLSKFNNLKFTFKKILSILFLLVTILFLIQSQQQNILVNIFQSEMVERIEGKIEKINNSSSELTLFDERGYDKILLYPEKIIFGAGEGMNNRFIHTAHQLELHATYPSILFYYGIIPTILVIIWSLKNIRKLNLSLYSVYLALFIESMTLANQRQPFFWMILILGYVYKNLNKIEGGGLLE